MEYRSVFITLKHPIYLSSLSTFIGSGVNLDFNSNCVIYQTVLKYIAHMMS